MKTNRIIIFTNGEFSDLGFYAEIIKEDDYIICADGGANHAFKIGVIPDLVVGDLDSIDDNVYKNLQESKTKFHDFPSEKDESDLEIALLKALERKPQEIMILGALGKRMDHFFANVTLLTIPLAEGVKAKIIDETHEITIINKGVDLEGEKGDYLSLFPLTSKVTGICTQGLKYPLKKEDLFLGPTRGLSNEFINARARIDFQEGLLLVIKVKK